MTELQTIYSEIKEFLEDIYIYLSNIECSTGNTSQDKKSLLKKCETFLSFFEKIYDGIECDGQNSCSKDDSYLEMGGFGKIYQKNKNQSNDYSNGNNHNDLMIESAQLYDNCQPTGKLLTASDLTVANECPYSNLSAENFHIKDSPKQGYLHLLEKRILFDQWKKVYVVLMGRWLLIYNEGLCDSKPSTCVCIESIAIPLKTENRFTICSTSGKRWSMQVATRDETEDWYQKIQQEFPKDYKSKTILGSTKTNDSTISLTRRLPSPPISKRNHKFFSSCAELNLGHQRSDDIYEEPTPMKQPEIKPQIEKSIEINNDLNENTSVKVPKLPKKEKKYWKKCNQLVKIHYDVPKKLRSPIIENETHELKLTHFAIDHGVNTSPKKELKLDIESASITKSLSVSQHSLSNVIFDLPPLETKSPKTRDSEKLNKAEKSNKSKRKSVISSDSSVEAANKTPVKSWFMNRLGRSSEKMKKTDCQLLKSKSTTPPPATSTTSRPAEINKQNVKGGKVNMIINQLEANGHLHLLSKSLKEKRRSYYAESVNRENGGDSSQNYEPINMKN